MKPRDWSWAHLLPGQADSNLTTLPPLNPDEAPYLTPASPETALLLHSSACWLLLLPAGVPCLPPFTSAYHQLLSLAFLVGFPYPLLHHTLSFLFQHPFQCLLSPALRGCSSVPHSFHLLEDL